MKKVRQALTAVSKFLLKTLRSQRITLGALAICLSAGAASFVTFEIRYGLWSNVGSGLLFGWVLWSVFVTLRFVFYSGIKIGEETPDSKSNDEFVTKLVYRLRQRAISLKVAARFTLCLIVGVLVSGSLVFTYAESLAGFFNESDSMKKAASFTENAVNRATVVIDQMIATNSERFFSSGEPAMGQTRNYYGSPGGMFRDRAMWDQDVYRYRAQLTSAFKREFARELNDQVSEALGRTAKSVDSPTGESSMNSRTWITLGTKIGAILLYAFFVQVLVALYRYNVRLAAFYDSRADVLQIVGEASSLKMEDALKLFSSDSLDFSGTPKYVTEQLVEGLVKIAKTKGAAKE